MGWETRTTSTQDPDTPGEAFHEAVAQISELREYASYFVSAKLDAIKAGVRSGLVYAALGIVGGIAGAAFLACAAVLLLVGLAHGLGALFGGRDWLGDLIIGVLVLGAAVAGAIIGIKKITGASRKQTVEKYETRKLQQRQNFGHDVKQRAREQSDR